ncbi:MAG: hypothetical protein H6817_06165 [Phycisphaerales bacterium]|nr:hypothetical protein [Phycisphaerales bacterium]
MTASNMLAYIDPGAGTILLQVLVGSIVGVVIFFRQSLSRLVGLFKGRGTQGEPTTDEIPRS